MTGFAAAATVARQDMIAVFARAFARIGRPGATWNGAQRVAIAVVARSARSGTPIPVVDLPDAAVEAAAILGGTPAMANPRWLEETVVPAIGHPGYVEIVGLVAQLTAVDTYHRAMGLPLEPLPEPADGAPTGDTDPDARLTSSWVPTAGPGVVYALSLVPGEMAGFMDLHGPLYIPVEEMGDDRFARTLSRPQMELIAARTSAINDCFY